MLLSSIGLLAGLALLMVLTMRGVNIIIAAIVCSSIVAITGGLSLEKALTDYYMSGFTGFFASWFLVFLLGAVFGKAMEETEAASAIADWVKRRIGANRAVFAVVAACAVMTYGGVSVFIVAFSVYPIAVALFKSANLPHRFIPAAMAFGSISFTMTSPGSPEVQNLIPTEFFNTTPTAGGLVGVLMALLIMVSGGFFLKRMVTKAVQAGEIFQLPGEEEMPDHPSSRQVLGEISTALEETKKLPSILIAILPLVLVVVILNVMSTYVSATWAIVIALFIGIAVALVLMNTYTREYGKIFGKGSENALLATANTCAVVGFGSVAKEVPSFKALIETLVNTPGMEYAGLAIAVTVIAGITGSASGGLGIALPILAPLYMTQGLDPGAMHRISALASGGLDSLPHNGYIVTTVRAVCNETHKRAYKPIFVLSVVVPMIAVILAVILYTFL
ncbi:GntP family permease [Priestia abyssalis]|uniref:GntP family permease n=1 Tax=Priestia abyssalis TaxID=1221450 RepID=UPI000995C475|nr:Na+/H+ antiporter NhaC family protein [Priestia abyssalis]